MIQQEKVNISENDLKFFGLLTTALAYKICNTHTSEN